MSEKDFDELRMKFLPTELQEHFDKNRKVIDNNMAKFEEIENELSKQNQQDLTIATLSYIMDFGKEQYRTANMLLEHNELLYMMIFVLKKNDEKLENAFSQQGVKVDGLLKYDDALKFINDYIKRSSRDLENE